MVPLGTVAIAPCPIRYCSDSSVNERDDWFCVSGGRIQSSNFCTSLTVDVLLPLGYHSMNHSQHFSSQAGAEDSAGEAEDWDDDRKARDRDRDGRRRDEHRGRDRHRSRSKERAGDNGR